jgi:UDP-glucose 4-epimerase
METMKNHDAAGQETVQWNEWKVLVTGGGGFLGSAVVDALLKQGASVAVLDDWSTGVRERLPDHPRLSIFTGSVLDPKAVAAGMQGCAAVAHFAATDILLALRDPAADCDVNVRGTLNVLLAARETPGVRRVVYASTDAVYGNPRYLPINEDDSLSPLSPFAVSKLSGELYCRAFYESFGLSATVLRYANVYGPSTGGRPAPGVVARFLEAAKSGQPISVHGDGEQTRDLVFLADAVDATLLAFTASKADGQVYNIGTGIEVTVNTLASAVARHAGSTVSSKFIHRLDIDNIRRRVLNIEKIRRELRWTPRFTLDQGLHQMLTHGG